MNDYTPSDHKIMMQDTFLEISQISREVKKIRGDVQLLNDDISHLTRSIKEFQQVMKDTQRTIPEQVAEVAMQSFDEQLKKMQILQDFLDKLSQGDVIFSHKKRWFGIGKGANLKHKGGVK